MQSDGDVFRACGWARHFGTWVVYDEATGFYLEKADASGNCRAGLLQLNRVFNPRYALSRVASSERLVTSDSAAKEMVGEGWFLLPTTMCARP